MPLNQYRIRHLPWRWRILMIWLVESSLLGTVVGLRTEISAINLPVAITMVICAGLFNSLLRVGFVRLSVRPSFPVLGLAALGLNSLIAYVLVKSAAFSSITLSTAILSALAMTTLNIAISNLLAIDDDDGYFRHLVSGYVRTDESRSKREFQQHSDTGIVFLEIDGLAEPVLRRALESGVMPTLARWMALGSHDLVSWECDLSSQTSASQAGILLGNNHDIPAFRWFEKERRKVMVSNLPTDARELESRLSQGDGLLANGGASRSNLFSGDAPETIFTFSTMTDMSRHGSHPYYPAFMGAYNILRVSMLFIWELVLEWKAASFQQRKNVRPRIERGGIYPFLRAATTILLRELNLFVLIGDLFAGIPTVYTTFFGYDEVAHHSGIERPDTLEVLRKLDEQLDRLERLVTLTPTSYRFVVLSDHGQSQGATFRQRYGMTLDSLVRQMIDEGRRVEAITSESTGWGKANLVFTDVLNDIVQSDGRVLSRLFRRVVRGRILESTERPASLPSATATQMSSIQEIVIGPISSSPLADESAPIDVLVLGSGNLGLIYFARWKDRLTYEQINVEFPRLIDDLAEHAGIGFLLVHSDEHGPLVVGDSGIHYLATGRVKGEDPLAPFSPHAPEHLRRTSGFPHVADIMVNSCYDPTTEEVAAFEELVGSHGGLGGPQSRPFLLYPSEWELDDDEIVGAVQLHRQLKFWIERYNG